MTARDDWEGFVERLGVIDRVIVPGALRAAVRTGAELDLPLTQLTALFLVRAEGSVTVNQIAAHIDGSLSAGSRVVNQLVSRGLVDRVEDPADRRAKRVSITERGTAVLGSFERVVTETHARIFDHLTADERAALMTGLDGVAAAYERLRSEQ